MCCTMDDFVSQLVSHMRANGITQKQLATAVGTSQAGVSRVLKGSEKLTFDRAERFARAVGMRIHLELEKIS
uniref:Helix-turn-helix domain protein n=2 Tax=Rubinisphaera brasiliensis TaxID=119 RepID=F0SNI0_RUBBR|nr:helix-turn-helix domain protein [Rubinisphaera brasiliensis DSM 5305]